MKRGEIWSVSGGSDYSGKPRPAVVVQDDYFSATQSITICVFTTDETSAPLFRVEIAPSSGNGLGVLSRLMVDKIATVPKTKIGKKLGKLDDADIVRVNRALMVFLGLARAVGKRS